MILTPSTAIITVFGVTVFLGAFLLFQVQLLIGKYILPWYGGVPMVWTTCMLCFQLLLLAGYAYAHLLVRRLRETPQRMLHLAVVAASLALVAMLVTHWGVPLLPDPAWKPNADETPVWHIVQLLAIAVGAPFFVAATTSPLIQAWFATTYPTTSPYRLYALSNLGSLLALLTYPAVFEVWLPLRSQAWLWLAGFLLFALGIAACALATGPGSRGSGQAPPARGVGAVGGVTPTLDVAKRQSLFATGRGGATPPTPPAPHAGDWLLWTTLAAIPSALLLATTNYMSQEIAVVPMLWIVPLSLYLASFVLTFDSERWYARGVWATLLALGITLSAFVLERGIWASVLLQIGVAAFTLFAACMVCHGELARTKPAASHLTSFYLAITLGGAAGGTFVSLAAPVLFSATWEYPLGLWMVAALALLAFHRDQSSPLHASPPWTLVVTAASTLAIAAYVFRQSLPWTPEISDVWLFGTPAVVAVLGFTSRAWGYRRRRADTAVVAGPRHAWLTATAAAVGLVVVGIALAHVAWSPLANTVERSRSFYGTVNVEAVDPDGDGHVLRLRHGRIVHGLQYRAPDHRREPTAYYGRDSGIGLAIEHHPRRAEGLRVGVVGLGVGTLAAYGSAGDTLRFYEINPDVIRLAGLTGHTFTYVRDSEARVEIAVGDARLVLEAELARGLRQRFDVLALDAFSSDSVPVHLLTREAIGVYLAHLDPGGFLAIHISNRYLELKPVLRGIAAQFGLAYVFVSAPDGDLTYRSTWALLARDGARLAIAPITDARDVEPAGEPSVLWTDDYSNLLRLVKR